MIFNAKEFQNLFCVSTSKEKMYELKSMLDKSMLDKQFTVLFFHGPRKNKTYPLCVCACVCVLDKAWYIDI